MHFVDILANKYFFSQLKIFVIFNVLLGLNIIVHFLPSYHFIRLLLRKKVLLHAGLEYLL